MIFFHPVICLHHHHIHEGIAGFAPPPSHLSWGKHWFFCSSRFVPPPGFGHLSSTWGDAVQSCWVPLGVSVPLKCPHPLSEGADRAGMRTEVLSEFPTSRSPLPSPFHLCDLFGCIAGQTDSFVSFSLFCSWGCWFPIPGAAHPSDSSGPSSVSPVWSSADQEWGASCSCSASAALQKCFPLNLFHNYFPFIIFFSFCSIFSVSSGLEPLGIFKRKHELISSGERVSSLQFASLGGLSCPLAFNKLHSIKEWLWIRLVVFFSPWVLAWHIIGGKTEGSGSFCTPAFHIGTGSKPISESSQG